MVCQCGEERAVDNELTKKDFHALLVAGMCVIGMCWMSRAWSEEMPMLYLTKAPEESVAMPMTTVEALQSPTFDGEPDAAWQDDGMVPVSRLESGDFARAVDAGVLAAADGFLGRD